MIRRWTLSLLVGLCGAGGCHPTPPSARAPALALEGRAGAEQRADGADQTLFARHVELVQRAAFARPVGFARLDERQRASLERLAGRSTWSTRVYLIADRALIVPQARHPAGGLELLVCTDLGRLVVFAEDRWAYDLPLSKLPDVLDRTTGTSRRESISPVQSAMGPTSAPARRMRQDRLLVAISKAEVTLRYAASPRGSRGAWSLRQRIETTHPAAVRAAPGDFVLYTLMSPLLQTRTGRLLLESLQERSGTPLGWSTTTINESFAASPALQIETRVHDRGWVKLTAARFAAHREGYRRAARLGAPSGPGTQLVSSDQLAALRTGTRAADFTVENRSQMAALVFLDGALIGWVAPEGRMSFAGAGEGFYHAQAITPTGVRGWVSEGLYLPGTFVLR